MHAWRDPDGTFKRFVNVMGPIRGSDAEAFISEFMTESEPIANIDLKEDATFGEGWEDFIDAVRARASELRARVYIHVKTLDQAKALRYLNDDPAPLVEAIIPSEFEAQLPPVP